ncbi:efflux RND transporter periplasmic adaptor subunit [Pararcticibacter amylolyticus]|uniref:Efflux RND transporter periplasmic adaptor subunit n=1 Tax=Pararcticibacter amylolyticus TaxID=2173175 RepID=A0A2U2PAQ9_9SPHI|nr:efflux RND transporter periplasmic adaptor subunit [Pararcticibacter amylolyticus]PWG78472.1 efflux RND transporter periplasmic adaptor subunit [Pararcticibacter amylolyticus]
MKRNRKIIIPVAAVALILLAWLLFFRKKEQMVSLQTEKPQRGDIAETVTATGTIQPVDTTAVGSRVSGTIEALYADFNSTVKKGQLLAELDPSIMQASVDQFKASLTETRSNLDYQQSNFNRQKELYTTGALSRAEYELALNSYNNAKASVKNIEAQLYSAERNLSFTKIYAPVDGVILNRTVSVGQTVAASFSTPTLFSIAKDITKMQVQAKVDEADIGNVAKGLKSTFTVDAYLNSVFNGTVEEIRLSPVVSSNVVTYTTIINAPNEDKKLKPGMTANVTIYTQESKNTLLAPAKALKFNPDSSLVPKYIIVPLAQRRAGGPPHKTEINAGLSQDAFVWTLQGNKILQKRIKTGLNNNTQVEVLEGLSANDVLITGSLGGAEAQAAAGSSPFMPKPPGRKK